MNNEVFDPFHENDGGWYWYAHGIRVPALWDAASDAGIDVGNVMWPATVGARIRHNIPQFWRMRGREDEKLLDLLSTPRLYAEVAHAAAPPGEHRTDRSRADAAITILRAKRPGLMLAYLTDLDSAQHIYGPMSPQAWSELERIDGLLNEILLAANGLPRLAVAVVSDHGFLPVESDIRPNVALREAGLLTTTAREESGPVEAVLAGYEAITWKAGGSAAIMGRNGRQEPTASRVRELFAKLAADPANRISEVIDGAEAERQGGFPGAIVVLQAARGAMFTERLVPPMVARSSQRGAHGYRPDVPEMGASLIFWGSGVRPGELGDVEMTDVAPTLAALLGVALPSAQGKVISAALTP